MSLANYTDLKKSIIEWGKRGDLDLLIDDFIQLAEKHMFANEIEVLKLRDGETRAAFSTKITDRFAALPTGFQSMRKIRIQIVNGSSYELEYRTPSQLQISSIAGLPCFFTVTDQIEFDRISDKVYTGEIQYFQEFTPLSDTNATNAVLTNYPNIYLFGALAALKQYVELYDEAANYYSQFISSIKGANKKANLGRYGPSPVMRVDGPTP